MQRVRAIGKPPDNQLCLFRHLKNVVVLPSTGMIFYNASSMDIHFPAGDRSLASGLSGGDLDGWVYPKRCLWVRSDYFGKVINIASSSIHLYCPLSTFRRPCTRLAAFVKTKTNGPALLTIYVTSSWSISIRTSSYVVQLCLSSFGLNSFAGSLVGQAPSHRR